MTNISPTSDHYPSYKGKNHSCIDLNESRILPSITVYTVKCTIQTKTVSCSFFCCGSNRSQNESPSKTSASLMLLLDVEMLIFISCDTKAPSIY